jgi:hypothetical protein
MADSPLKTLVKSGLVIGAFVLLFALVGVRISPMAAAVTFGAFAAVAYAADTTGGIDVSFVLLSTAIIAIAGSIILPDAVGQATTSILQALGFPAVEIQPVLLLAFALLVITTVWVIDIRFISTTAKKPSTVVKRLTRRYERLFDEYAQIGRLIAVGLASLGAIFLGQFAVGFGEVGTMLAEAPAFVGWVLTSLAGYLSLGGSLPIVGSDVPLIGTLTAGGFAVLVGLILLVALGVRYGD